MRDPLRTSPAPLTPVLYGTRPITLAALVPGVDRDVRISALEYSSDRVHPGALFFCVPGFRVDGHAFAPEAVRRGAVALVCERSLDLGVPEVVVPDVRAAMARVAARFYGHPARELMTVGVTGTNGKTTVSWLVHEILRHAGIPTGLVGTVESVVGGQTARSERTTPESIDLQRNLRAMAGAGDRACVMEVSSHGLALHRVDAIDFTCRIFTNLSHDHLDFHGSMERYFATKRQLFAKPALSVVNVDDAYGRRLAHGLPGRVTYAIDHAADYHAHDIDFDASGSRFVCDMPMGRLSFRSPLPGVYNVSNAIAAIAATDALGIDRVVLQRAVSRAQGVRGRLQPIDEGQPFAVFVDYAHNPAALESVLRTARVLTAGRVHVVFGAPGDRDRTKRPEMAAVACALADRVTVTSDDPYSEDPDAIIDDIIRGARGRANRIADRRAAITQALQRAAPADTVIIAGRGHELVQEFAAGRRRPFDDALVARDALHDRGWHAGEPEPPRHDQRARP